MSDVTGVDQTGAFVKDDNQELRKATTKFSEEFEVMCRERWAMGEEQYGEFAFTHNDVLQYALEEVADLANYARMQFIKIKLLMLALEERTPLEDGAFIPVTPAT